SVSHGGRTNGYTVPSPQAHGAVIARALEQAGVRSQEVSYVEAHGTGTKLGDPIEVQGLAQAFAQTAGGQPRSQPCWLGSAKSNIGHLESAAVVAGLAKVLLQM